MLLELSPDANSIAIRPTYVFIYGSRWYIQLPCSSTESDERLLILCVVQIFSLTYTEAEKKKLLPGETISAYARLPQ